MPSAVEVLVEELERRVIRVSAYAVSVGAPGTLALTIVEARRGQPYQWLLAELIAFTVAAIVLWSRASHVVKTSTLVALLDFVSAFALFHFGPTIGTGLFFVAAALSASFFLSRRGLVLTLVFLTGALASAPMLSALGLLRPTNFAPEPLTWLRMSIVTIATLLAVVYLMIRIHSTLRQAFVAEMTARKAEQATHLEREQLLRAAETTQRLESLGRLAGGVAHDLNNALTVVRSGVALLASTDSAEERANVVHEIEAGMARVTSTARQLMTFAKGSPRASATSQPGAQLTMLSRSVTRLLPANIALTVEATPTAAIGMDSGTFDQVVLNLILNARDAMPNGGRLTLSCRPLEERRVVVEIRDEGVGMSPEVRARAFEPFFTTKGEEGSGLGLAMVWRQVTRAGGTVELESTPGAGTLFRLILPSVAASPAPPSRATLPAAASGRLLLVEDEDDVRRAMERILKRARFDFDSAATTQEAMDLIATNDHCILVTDAMLPDGPVGPVIAAFHARHPGAPVIVCSGYTEDSEIISSIVRESVTSLPKPFAPDALLATISRLLAAAPS